MIQVQLTFENNINCWLLKNYRPETPYNSLALQLLSYLLRRVYKDLAQRTTAAKAQQSLQSTGLNKTRKSKLVKCYYPAASQTNLLYLEFIPSIQFCNAPYIKRVASVVRLGAGIEAMVNV